MKKWLLLLLVLVALGFALKWTVLAPDPIAVRTFEVDRGIVEATVTNSKAGTIKARRRAKLSTGTSGIVVELGARRGERVKEGDVLLRLDDATQSSQLSLAERAFDVAVADHARACIAAQRALRELDRNRKLAADKIVSEDVLDGLESNHELAGAQCKVAEAEVERSRASVAVARAEHEKTILRAPFDAIIAEVSVEIGEWVTPSVPLLAAPELLDAIDPSSLYVSAPMDEVDAALLAVGQIARLTIDPYPDREFPGKVARVSPYVLDLEQQNRTLEIEVELDDQAFSATLLPGTSADVEVILDTADQVLRIPSYCLLDGSRVLVVEDSILVRRQVEVGLRNWQWAEITGGLSVGEHVVTSLDREDVVEGAEVVLEES